MLDFIKNSLEVFFYCSDSGNEPVREWLKSLSKENKKIVGEDIKILQFGCPLGMPLVKNLGDKLWEIRSNLNDKRIARIIFCLFDNAIILLHGFIKKSQKTPKQDIEIALRRKKAIERGGI